MSTASIEYSVVIPVHNEEASLKPLLNEMFLVLDALKKPYEINFVNDGSNDQSKDLLEGFRQQFPQKIRVIHLPERRGQTFAMKAGLELALGRVIITLDADLQNDPADIPRLVKKLDEGYNCVCGWRKSRQDTFLKAKLSQGGNRLQRWLTGLSVHDISCTLRIYERTCVPKIPLNWEGQHRFIPLALFLQGYSIGEIVSNHRERKFGCTKYSHKRIFRVLRDFFRIIKIKGSQ